MKRKKRKTFDGRHLRKKEVEVDEREVEGVLTVQRERDRSR